MKELDVRGLSCPEPLMAVDRELNSGNKQFKILISEPHQRANVEHFLKGKNVSFVTEETNGEFVVTVK